MLYKMLNAVTADTVGAWFPYNGGTGLITIESSNLGGGSVEIQVQRASDTGGIALDDSTGVTSFTSETSFRLALPGGVNIRAVLSGSTTPSALTVALFQ